jgi:alpha-amylase
LSGPQAAQITEANDRIAALEEDKEGLQANLDIANPDVRKELLRWGEWYTDITGVDGFRFDAVKHVGADFFVEWLNHVRNHTGRDLFAVGEYWSGVNEALEQFIR